MKSFAWRLTRTLLVISFFVVVIAAGGMLYYMQFELPDIDALKTTQAQAPLRIYTHDGKLIAEFGEKRSNPVPFDRIPTPLINAVLATEDQHYYQHPGIDITGLLRAGIKLILTGKKEEGGSTITMQVARNFYLSRHKTFGRKIQEILLAIKIDHGLTKQKILELYLNTIFLGNRAYGVGAAAEIYYGKPLAQLSLDQYAMLAGLPKAPSALNPIANPDAAKKRRDHVLNRMREVGMIDQHTYEAAIMAPLAASYHDLQVAIKAPYAAEYARLQLEEMYGDSIYTDGFNVYTTIDANLQDNANHAVHDKLIAYDQRHGYRGPEKNLGTDRLKDKVALRKIIAAIPFNGIEPAVVTSVNDQNVTAMRADGSSITIPWQGISWARRQVNADYLGHIPSSSREILKPGDVIRITPNDNSWRLAQIPKAEGSMVALNPQNGGILALVGGFDYQHSNFNRVTNAQRQPGSSFKPFVYSAALEKGFTLASVINDAPIVIDNPDNTVWRPQNDSHQFYGPTRLRMALTHSLNLVSIRLLQQIEIPYAISHIERFGFTAGELPTTLSLALGTASVTPLEMVSAYAIFANGGFKVTPYLVESIRNSQNEVIYQARPLTACQNCATDVTSTEALSTQATDNSHAPQAITPQNAYLITSALHDVIELGSAKLARSLKRNDLAGKTGTTNNQIDAWFAGYNANLVAIAWVGFDQPQSLHEYGAKAALPMWIQFMDASLKGKPDLGVPEPPGIMSIKIDPLTGSLANATDPQAITEYFMEPYLPTGDSDENKTDTTDGTSPGNSQTNGGAVY
jgi:penicillin-binding protein 1A